MYAHSQFVVGDDDRTRSQEALDRLQKRMYENIEYYSTNNVVLSAFEFLKKTFQIPQNSL